MQNKFFNSKFNIVLLGIIIILLVIITLQSINENKQYPEVVDEKINLENPTTKTELKEYKNTKLGLEFSYPSSWGTASEEIYNNDLSNPKSLSFEYNISFSTMPSVSLSGKSNPYTIVGRDGWSIDLTEDDMNKSPWVCDHSTAKIYTKNNIEGIYGYTTVLQGDIDAGCNDFGGKTHYAVFDFKSKIENLVVWVGTPNMSKEEFTQFVNSITVQ